ncbi:MAG: hypothetical protein OEM23_06430 [Gemmatimonadota bacterium]|nr:hypothetical protein [Gemmatimonadota bacterium]MDH3428056.1 hypothetical protein [Gemmatimonadota bacterium]
MHRRTKITGSTWLLAAAWLVPSAVSAQALAAPEGWKTSAERFVAMPPGFHITTSGSVLLYDPDARGGGDYAVESDGFLFPGASGGTYGLFIGGSGLDSDDAVWTSFEIGRDGNWVVRTRAHRDGEHLPVVSDRLGPEPGPVVLPGENSTGQNVLRIEVGDESVAFLLNGERVGELPRAEVSVEGIAGFRVGVDIDLHLISFDIISEDTVRSFAPAREEDS